MCLNQPKPFTSDSLYKKHFSKSELSDILSCYKQIDFLHVFKIHIPASTIVEELYIYPKWGEESVMKLWNFSLCSSRNGKDVLTIIPPKLWAINEIFPSEHPGQYYVI